MKTAQNLEQCGNCGGSSGAVRTGRKKKLSNRIQEYYGLEGQYVEIEIAGGRTGGSFS